MAEGKQISFLFGEISETLQYRSGMASYAQAMAKLKNSFVRREGGVSRRAGTVFLRKSVYSNLTNIRSFELYSLESREGDEFVFSDSRDSEFIAIATNPGSQHQVRKLSDWVRCDFYQDPVTGLSGVRWFNGEVELTSVSVGSPPQLTYGITSFMEQNPTIDISKIQIGSSNGWVYVTPSFNFLNYNFQRKPNNNSEPFTWIEAAGLDENVMIRMRVPKIYWFMDDIIKLVNDWISQNPPEKISRAQVGSFNFVPAWDAAGSNIRLVSGSLGYSSFGQQPILPVTYIFTLTNPEGEEALAATLESTGFSITEPSAVPPNTVVHPHANLKTSMVFDPSLSGLQGYTVSCYRAPTVRENRSNTVEWGNIERGHPLYGLVWSAKILGGGGGISLLDKIVMYDQGQINNGITPAVDFSMLKALRMPYVVKTQGSPDVSSELITAVLPDIVAGAIYQQRQMLSKASMEVSDSGDVLVSKLGSVNQIAQPQVSRNSEAFTFSTPSAQGRPVHSMLSLNRAILFSEDEVHIARGDESGILTPLTANNILVSTEGCAAHIKPVVMSGVGYWVNRAEKKLLSINVGADGSWKTQEESALANHIFSDKRIIQLCAIEGEDNMIFFLYDDGTMAQATRTVDGNLAFSGLVEVGGPVKSLYVHHAVPINSISSSNYAHEHKQQRLGLYVDRGGVLSEEYLETNRYERVFGEVHADCSIQFGYDYLERFQYSVNRELKANYYSFDKELPALISYDPDFPNRVEVVSDLIYAGGSDTEGEYLRSEHERLRLFLSNGDSFDFSLVSMSVWDEDIQMFRTELSFSGDLPQEIVDNPTTWFRLQAAYRFIDKSTFDIFVHEYDPLKDMWDMGIREVSIMADGSVVSSPLNPEAPTFMIEEIIPGVYQIDLEGYYCSGNIGIAYQSSQETLDIEPSDTRTLVDSGKLVTQATMALYKSARGFVGLPDQPLENKTEMSRQDVDDMVDDQPRLTGAFTYNFPSRWNRRGRVEMVQVDPLPFNLLSIYPSGMTSGD